MIGHYQSQQTNPNLGESLMLNWAIYEIIPYEWMKAPGVWSKKTWCNSGNHWKSVPPPCKKKKKKLHGKFEIATFRIDFLGEVCAYQGKGGGKIFPPNVFPKKFNESSLVRLSSNLLSLSFWGLESAIHKGPHGRNGVFSSCSTVRHGVFLPVTCRQRHCARWWSQTPG